VSIKDELLKSRRDLKREFTAVRNAYFPKWDRMRRWKCRFLPATMAGAGCEGLCNCESRIIYIPTNTENQTAVLIHEICHAVTPSANHGPQWQQQMRKAATVANRTGQSQLAKFLRKEIVSYQGDAEPVTPKAIYCEIEECVSDLTGIPRFPTVAKLVAQRNLMTIDKFLKRYARAETVYNKAVSLKRADLVQTQGLAR
jgi:hypothetical protein